MRVISAAEIDPEKPEGRARRPRARCRGQAPASSPPRRRARAKKRCSAIDLCDRRPRHLQPAEATGVRTRRSGRPPGTAPSPRPSSSSAIRRRTMRWCARRRRRTFPSASCASCRCIASRQRQRRARAAPRARRRRVALRRFLLTRSSAHLHPAAVYVLQAIDRVGRRIMPAAGVLVSTCSRRTALSRVTAPGTAQCSRPTQSRPPVLPASDRWFASRSRFHRHQDRVRRRWPSRRTRERSGALGQPPEPLAQRCLALSLRLDRQPAARRVEHQRDRHVAHLRELPLDRCDVGVEWRRFHRRECGDTLAAPVVDLVAGAVERPPHAGQYDPAQGRRVDDVLVHVCAQLCEVIVGARAARIAALREAQPGCRCAGADHEHGFGRQRIGQAGVEMVRVAVSEQQDGGRRIAALHGEP